MNILYSVQATGNGHISRAIALWPHLCKYGNVDIFLSGSNSHLPADLPVKYRSKGISLFYNHSGGLDYWEILKGIQPMRIRQEIRDLPVEKYDLVLNDYDHITSAACMRKGIPSIHFGHQASFQSPRVPRPAEKSFLGELLLKNFVKATHPLGLHFRKYDDHIFPAIVRKDILEARPVNREHITVYLPSWRDQQLFPALSRLKRYSFQVFSAESAGMRKEGNIIFLPVNKALFTRSLVTCAGIITGGGFETPAEALHLGKKIISIPIRGQYEQQCNAAALSEFGAMTLAGLDASFTEQFHQWIGSPSSPQVDYSHSIPGCLEYIFKLYEQSLRRAA